MKALILCAGAGSRLRPLTQILPKPLVAVAGVPLAVRQMLALKRAGIRRFVVNLGWGAKRIMGALGDGSRWGVEIEYSYEADTAEEALETLGGIVKALPLLTEDDDAFIVAAGDIASDLDYSRLVHAAQSLSPESALAHLVLVPNPSWHAAGDLALAADGRIALEGEKFTFSSLSACRKEMFEGLAPVRAPLFPWMKTWIAGGRVSGELFCGRWANVGTPEELARACAAFAGERLSAP